MTEIEKDQIEKRNSCYKEDLAPNWEIIYSLNKFGLDTINSCYLKRNFPKYIEATKRRDEKLLHPFVFNQLSDHIKIIIFFENHFKAKLLEEGYVVHTHKIHKTNKRPYKFSELLVDQSYTEALASMQINTLQMSVLLQDNFQSILKTPKNVLSRLSNINSQRNDLHLLAALDFFYGKEITEGYIDLFRYVIEVENELSKKKQFSLVKSTKKL